MTFNTLKMKETNDNVSLTGQQDIDADIILPDYYDTIGKILRCELHPVTEAVNVSNEKSSVAGIAKLTLIYCGEDKKIYCYENEFKYTKIFQSQNTDDCIVFGVTQNVFSLNYRAIGPKRIEVRGIIQIIAKLRYYNEKSLISSIDDDSLIAQHTTFKSLTPVNISTKTFSISNNYSASDFSEEITVILRKDSKIKISEIKTIHNKAYIKGTAETEIIYYSEKSGNVCTDTLSSPFSEILDIFGAEEDDLCKVYINEVYTHINIKGTDISKSAADIRTDVSITAEAFRKSEDSVVSDVYSIKDEIISKRDCCNYISDYTKISKNDNISFETDLYDDNSYSVIKTWTDGIKLSYEKSDNRFLLLMSMNFNILMKDSEGILNIISRNYTYETSLINENNNAIIRDVSANVLSLSALQVSGGKIRINADILIEADLMIICQAFGFTSIEPDSSKQTEQKSKFIVYFARKNEEIWSIAKDNKTSAEEIRRINNLSGNFITEDIMLLLPSF